MAPWQSSHIGHIGGRQLQHGSHAVPCTRDGEAGGKPSTPLFPPVAIQSSEQKKPRAVVQRAVERGSRRLDLLAFRVEALHGGRLVLGVCHREISIKNNIGRDIRALGDLLYVCRER